jgi:ribonuclease VapC
VVSSRQCVLDASALLAAIKEEPGEEPVVSKLPSAAMSSVNWSEVRQKAIAGGSDVERVRIYVSAYGLKIEPFTQADAEMAADIWLKAPNARLSLADRACLALAIRLDLPVLTADRVWASLNLGVRVQLLR